MVVTKYKYREGIFKNTLKKREEDEDASGDRESTIREVKGLTGNVLPHTGAASFNLWRPATGGV